MQFIVDGDNKLNFTDLQPSDTIQDISNALEHFLSSNPLPCHSCDNNCCRIVPIRPDNVFMKQPAFKQPDKETYNYLQPLKAFVELDGGIYFMPKKKHRDGFICHYNSDNKCVIYYNRPILCRLYTCLPISNSWNQLMNIIVQAYKDALEYEIMEQIVKSHGTRAILPSYPGKGTNPTLHAFDYSAKIGDLLYWAANNGRVDDPDIFYKA